MVVLAFLRREWLFVRSTKLPFALGLVQIVLSLATVYYLSRLIDSSALSESTPGYEGDYFGFAMIGFTTLALVEASLLAFSKRIRRDQTTGMLEAIMATPVPNWQLLLGGAAYEIIFAVVVNGLQVVVAVALFGFRPEIGVSGAVAIAVVYPSLLLIFCSLGILIAAFAIVYKDPAALIGLVSAAMAVLTGVWFPTDLLPGVLQAVSSLIPLTWANDVLRPALSGGELDWLRTGGLALTALVAVPASLRLFAAAADKARRSGTLGHY